VLVKNEAREVRGAVMYLVKKDMAELTELELARQGPLGSN
jgi:hypothetical protein